jgi:8-oxo-dGTP diphosphatase
MIKRIRVVAGLAVNAQNETLVGLRRPDKKRPSMWEYPGGKVELAEGDETALRREWREELGVDPRVGRRIARVTFNLESPVVISLYHVILGDLTPMISDDVMAIQWVTPLHAVEWLACVPSLYLFFPHVKAFLNTLASTAPR